MGIMTGALIAGVASSALSSRAQSSAAKDASQAQTAASNAQIAAQQEALAQSRQLLSPYVNAGNAALISQMDLLGIGRNGAAGQTRQINMIQNDPTFKAMLAQGEDAMLQNASATGGLRGGNIQGALAQYRPQMLNQQIQQRLSNLGGLSSIGQNAAAGVGNAGFSAADGISNAYGQIGSAQAGNALAQGQAQANLFGGIAGGIGQYGMMSQLGMFGGVQPMGGDYMGAF